MQSNLPEFKLVYNLRYENSDRIYVSTHVSYFYNVNHTVIETRTDYAARSELVFELE